jgi:hypothetical protein
MNRLQNARTMLLGSFLSVCTAAIAQAAVVHAYGADSSDVFSMSIAGLYTGNGLSVGTGDNRVLGVPNQNQVNVGDGPQATSASQTISAGTAGQAHSSASFGLIRLFASTIDAASGFDPHAGAIADAGWIDTMTISNAALTGQAGVMTFGIHVDGTLVGGAINGFATWQLGVLSSTTGGGGDSAQAAAFLGPSNTVDIDRVDVFSVDFVFGTPFELEVRSLVGAGLRSVGPALPPSSSALADFDNTIFWTGIQGVTQGGNPVDFLITAQSGTDYTRSFDPDATPGEVPEPAGLPLLALGAVLCGVLARRRLLDQLE